MRLSFLKIIEHMSDYLFDYLSIGEIRKATVLSHFSKRMTGIEPAYPAWEAGVLPMNYIRECTYYTRDTLFRQGTESIFGKRKPQEIS